MDDWHATRKGLLEYNPDFFKNIRTRLGGKDAGFFERIEHKDLVNVDVEKNREAVEKFMDNVPERATELKTKVKAMLEQQKNSIH